MHDRPDLNSCSFPIATRSAPLRDGAGEFRFPAADAGSPIRFLARQHFFYLVIDEIVIGAYADCDRTHSGGTHDSLSVIWRTLVQLDINPRLQKLKRIGIKRSHHSDRVVRMA